MQRAVSDTVTRKYNKSYAFVLVSFLVGALIGVIFYCKSEIIISFDDSILTCSFADYTFVLYHPFLVLLFGLSLFGYLIIPVFSFLRGFSISFASSIVLSAFGHRTSVVLLLLFYYVMLLLFCCNCFDFSFYLSRYFLNRQSVCKNNFFVRYIRSVIFFFLIFIFVFILFRLFIW